MKNVNEKNSHWLIIPTTAEEKRRNCEAIARRKDRLKERARKKTC